MRPSQPIELPLREVPASGDRPRPPDPMASVTISISSPTWLLRGLSMSMAPAMVIIMGIDLRIRGQERILVHGIADEIAHGLTGLVMLSVFFALGFRVHWVAGLLGAVAVDIDHVLLSEGRIDTIANSSRGVFHTLGPALAVLIVGVVLWPYRAYLWSFGFGMLTHLFRDSATSQLPLAWPLSDDILHLRYSLYLIVMVACTLVTTGVVALGARSWRSSQE